MESHAPAAEERKRTMGQYYLAVDIGASSGRHVLGCVRDGKIILEEVYRFENGLVRKNGRLCWDSARLFREIVSGMKRCAELGKAPASVGIDTWGVDFALLDADGELIGDTVGYRDSRTQGMDAEVEKLIPAEELYRRTGIQKQSFNTIYQLMAVKLTQPDQLRRAGHFLMMPEYFNYLLTGKIKNEYTNATTTGLLHAEKKNWDFELIGKLGLPASIFGPVFLPTTEVGGLKPEIRAEVGYDCKVVLPATHDTGSAVAAVPASGEDYAYISSGTWSLMGIETSKPIISDKALEWNFTNEGGVGNTYRFLRNIVGLWLVQECRRFWAREGKEYNYTQITEMAAAAEPFRSVLDTDHSS
ncbi:MAG TPA: rhamnulokinase, partial [Armatimonadetes bacterium]|nr:rhamnulokinase [Armatimonadota bacterium]